MFVVVPHFQGNTEHNQNNKCSITSMRRTAPQHMKLVVHF